MRDSTNESNHQSRLFRKVSGQTIQEPVHHLKFLRSPLSERTNKTHSEIFSLFHGCTAAMTTAEGNYMTELELANIELNEAVQMYSELAKGSTGE
jgi:hypothetical protein